LSDDPIERLNSIGFEWTIKSAGDKAFEEKFEKLMEFKLAHSSPKVTDVKLRRWVSKQLSSMKAGKLSKERKDKMESIGLIV
jgi:hypothetical protein